MTALTQSKARRKARQTHGETCSARICSARLSSAGSLLATRLRCCCTLQTLPPRPLPRRGHPRPRGPLSCPLPSCSACTTALPRPAPPEGAFVVILEEQRPHRTLWSVCVVLSSSGSAATTTWVSRKPNQIIHPFIHPPSPAILIPVPYEYLHLHLLCRRTCRCRCSKQLLHPFPPSLPRPDCLSPTQPSQIRAPNPKHFRQAQPAPAPAPAPPSCRSGCQFTHAFIRTHSRPFPLLPLPISLTHPGLPPATPQLIPYSTPNLSFIPRNPPKSKQFLSQTTARSTKKNKIFLSNTDTTRFQSTKLVCASFISYAPFEPCACVAQAHLIPRGFY